MFKQIIRSISTFLVVVMLFNMLPMQSFADLHLDSTEQIEIKPTESTAEKVTIVQEITENRSEYSKEFLLSNGLHMATVYAEPVHYEKDGKWADIDNTLVTHTDGMYKNTAGVWEVSFPQSFGSNQSISVTKDGYTLSFGMPQKLTTGGNSGAVVMSTESTAETFAVSQATTVNAQIDSKAELLAAKAEAEHPETVLDKLSSRLTYANVHSNTNVVYDLDSNRVKESIVLAKPDDTLRGYRYTLNVGTMIPVLQDDGSIIFYAPDEETVVMVMPAPYLQDNVFEISTDVSVTLTGKGSQYVLTYTLPQEWLASEDRQWPVILDPVIKADLDVDNIIDAVIASNHTYSYTNPILDIGLGSSYGIKRSFLKYENLPQLTSADVIVSATLKMHQVVYRTISIPAEVHKVTGDWHSTTITWANQPGYDPIVEDFVMGHSKVDYKWDVTEIVQDWYRTGVNNGMMFKAPESVETGTVEKFRQFASSEYNVDDRPALEILFLNNNGLESHWDYSSTSVGRAGTGSVNIYTGNLVWTHRDLAFGGNLMPVSINHIHNANDAQKNSFGMGYGWRTNCNQLVYQWDEDGDGTIQSDELYYVWEDEDGTKHYFEKESYGVYRDEEGMELTLSVSGSGSSKTCTIEDKNGGKSYFDSKGRLIKIENNQKEPSNNMIAYCDTESMLIDSVTDGVGRVYKFTYVNGMLSKISFMGSDNIEHTNIDYTYENGDLKQVEYADGKKSTFTYNENHQITNATDIDGYQLSYTYNTIPEGTNYAPYRVNSVQESHNSVNGGHISFEYQHHQTVLTDEVNGTKLTYQFNDWGNTVAIMDDEGRAEYAKFARNDASDATSPGNQLTLSSKMQNTVVNLISDSSFEASTNWTAIDSEITSNITDAEHYLGNNALSVSGSSGSVRSIGFTAKVEQTYTFSGYVKVSSGTAKIGIGDINGDNVQWSIPTSSSEWTRIQVSYTNNTGADQTVYALFEGTAAYLDCVQVEQMPTASRYNLVNNGDFATDANWIPANTETADGVTTVPETATETATETSPVLSTNAYKITGKYDAEKTIKQEITVSGGAGDSFVFGGWAMGNSASLEVFENGVEKDFSLRCTIHYTDGETQVETVKFNQDVISWQFVSWAVAAEKEYSSVTLEAVYKNNANTVYFDGLQLFKEEFGTSYTYDEETGDLISVIDLQNKNTTYEYANNDLTKIIQDGKEKMSYTYDKYHNVLTATTKEGYVYTFTYDDYGNNTSVSITEKTENEVKKTITSSATYTDNHNHIATATDALGNVTRYCYNLQTGLLDWIQHPQNSESSRTEYSYDEMYRMSFSTADLYTGEIDTGLNISVGYTYTEDLLTAITTPTTTYNFKASNFSLRELVWIGTDQESENRYNLVNYEYDDKNRLERLDYGNRDRIEYNYDPQGRLLKETYEDGETVSYAYDNCGNLATVTDSETGTVTTYYYDLLNRNVGYREQNTNLDHSVAYIYDEENNLSSMTEVINGVSKIYTYTYNGDNKLVSETVDGVTVEYEYDGFDRISSQTIKEDETVKQTKIYGYADGSTENSTSTQVSSYNGFIYTHDKNGNILSVSDGTNTTSYVYDSQNQLIRENNQAAGKTWCYSYNDGGNIVSKLEYDYTTGELGQVKVPYSYSYTDSQWGDLLTAYGAFYEYDGIGNLLSDGTYSYTWEHGRELVGVTRTSGEQVLFTYDATGLRTNQVRKDNSGAVVASYSYIYNGGQLCRMTYNSTVVDFTYDASGQPMTMSTDGQTYYYVTNLQGDVVSIKDNTGTTIASYTYDAWGNILTQAGTLATLNPLRYRGYVYDEYTGWYYLQSRYYSPVLCRFVNADIQIADIGGELLGYNMFAYCMNNPVNRCDATGNWPNWGKMASGASLLAIGLVACAAAATVVSGGACTPLLVAACVTFVAGGMTVLNGVAEITESVTDYNYMRDGVYGGNEEAYELQKEIFKTTAEIGTAVISMGSSNPKLCFVAGTLVCIEAGYKAIEEITSGDYVWAWDEKTGDVSLKKVVETYINETEEVVHIFVQGEEIITTPSHPFYSPVKGWTDAVNLRAGDILITVNGELVIVEKIQHEILESPITVYNFQVEGYHTYYVSNVNILVHNSCGKPNGSYEIFTSNNRVYVGKGSQARMQASIRRLQKQGFEVVDSLWEPARDSYTAFVNEYMKMAKYDFDFGGKLINVIMSPGFKIFSSWL